MFTPLSVIAMSLLLGLSEVSSVLPPDLEEELRPIKHGLLDAPRSGDARIKTLDALALKAHSFVDLHPERAEPLVWEGIVLAQLSAAKRNMSSLGLAKKSRANFEAAEKIDPSALDWSVYSLLAYLYSHVPGWPIGFGDHKHAQQLYQRAIELNSASAEPHHDYGKFLLEEGNYTQAVHELSFALSAPLRVGEK